MNKESLVQKKFIQIIVYTVVLFCMPLISNAQDDRKAFTIEVGYAASTFDDVKLSGSYGMSLTGLPWQIKNNFYAGYYLSPLNFNFGLVDSDYTSDVIKLGPALGYYFKPTIFVTLPVAALCNVHFHGSDTQLAWGMEISPTFYVGSKKFGLYAGPMLTVGFTGGTKADFGFKAGIYF